MEIITIILAVLIALSVVAQITIIGRKRQPLTAKDVIVNLLFSGVVIWALLNG